MLYYTEFKGYTPAVVGKKIKYDNNIFSFDIESTSYIVLHGKQLETSKYLDLTDKEKDDCIFKTTMYIWQFSVNDTVYYGRTWQDFVHFLKMLNDIDPTTCKIVFVHNLAFEFQFLKSVVHFKNVFARKSHKVMKADLVDFNIQFRCSYFMSNCSLEQLAKVYNLDVQKLKGNLDYSKIRHFKTSLTKAELDYCSNDCLVVYEYIKMELKEYKQVNLLPLTSTGKVRRELQQKVENDTNYYQETFNAINVDPIIYDKLVQSFMGGYTHANYCYTDKIIPNVTSYDFTSSYPYVLLVEKYPMTQFRKCNIKSIKALSPKFAYIITIEFKDIESQYMNNFISQSKCKIRNGEYDNGRVIRAESLEITCTDVDLYIILASYNYKSYKILDCYYAIYDYLPIQYVNFILDKYENKTKYKGLNGYETEYSKAKNLFNSLYGMTVTNLICDETIYEDSTGEWQEKELTNDQIKKKLLEERKKAFLSFSWGVWVTAHARRNLIENIMKLDRYCLYADTDSVKLKQGFDINVIENYNKKVIAKIEDVCRKRNLKIDRFKPTDSKR